MRKTLLIVLLLAALVLAACGGGQQQAKPAGGEEATAGEQQGGEEMALPAGDPARGKELFNAPTLGNGPGCASCHSLEEGVTLVGPSLAHIATEAAGDAEKAGTTTEAFLYESIVNPNADIASGFQPNIMYQNYGKELSKQDIADIIAFLMTLK